MKHIAALVSGACLGLLILLAIDYAGFDLDAWARQTQINAAAQRGR
jgi:hypothetical protein